MLANHAIARGAYEAGVKVMSAYPGTPSTEVAEAFAQYKEVHAEWAPNEKVALEVGIGASVAGARALVCMKHVGLNVAADPLFTASYTGVNGGLVIVVSDDPGIHSSQNEQDSRYYARSAHVLMLEPASAQEAKDFTVLAFELSEKYDTPVIIRTTTRVSHSHGFVNIGEREDVKNKPYEKLPTKYIMNPSNAQLRHRVVEERDRELSAAVNKLEINKAVLSKVRKTGVVCSGVVFEYVREALPDASVFKVGTSYPLPLAAIKKFAQKVDKLFVIEELEPYMETEMKAAGIKCLGKEVFSLQGEISVAKILEKFNKTPIPVAQKLPVRPPVMCAGCPHRGVFSVLSKLKVTVNGDIGCYTLGAAAPLGAVDTVVCMGASIGMAHGFKLATKGVSNNVAVIGDSTFLHSGVTGLINAVYNQSGITLLILDNSTTGMTGHQDHPATGKTLKGEPAPQVDLAELCRACGVKKVDVIKADDLKKLEDTIKADMLSGEVSVIIAQDPCVMLDKSDKPLCVIEDCRSCGRCMKIGCPALVNGEGGVVIDKTLCVGCSLCAKMCAFGCIKEAKR